MSSSARSRSPARNPLGVLLAGNIPGRPITFPVGRQLSVLLGVVVVGGGALIAGRVGQVALLLLVAVGAFGIVAWALVGAAGGILTKLMAVAMNRSVLSIMMGGFGSGDEPLQQRSAGRTGVRETSVDDAALQLAYAGTVVFVPSYGLATAQAQHELVGMAQARTAPGVEVSYGIHPVAGQMPGDMIVLLAEANVPYPQLKDPEEINSQSPRTDVVLVVGVNDVTNPAARRTGNAVSGMPILDVDRARSVIVIVIVIVIKRSMGHGDAGIDNELDADPKTAMLCSDARAALKALHAGLQAYVG